MKFKIRNDWFFLMMRIIQMGLPSIAVLLIANRENSAILYAIGIVGLCLFFVLLYFELTKMVEITDTEVIVHGALAKQVVPIADITKITREKLFEIALVDSSDLKGIILRDNKTTSSGETEIAVHDEEGFIRCLLEKAPHIHNELEKEHI